MKQNSTILLLLLSLALFAQQQLTIHMDDGNQVTFPVETIDSITFHIDIPPRLPGMKQIPSQEKTFVMGHESIASSPHEVTFTYYFYMDSTEVTQWDFDRVMKEYYPWYRSLGWDTLSGKYGLGDSHPAYYTSWYDAALYCNAISKAEGKDTVYTYSKLVVYSGKCSSLDGIAINYTADGYRLPTEAEWEFACRGGTESLFFWGETSTDGLDYVWALENSDSTSHPVAQKKPNPYGLYDIYGNVAEHCNDNFLTRLSSAAVTNPAGLKRSATYKISRGAYWLASVDNMSIPSRLGGSSSPNSRSRLAGFRVVYSGPIEVSWY